MRTVSWTESAAVGLLLRCSLDLASKPEQRFSTDAQSSPITRAEGSASRCRGGLSLDSIELVSPLVIGRLNAVAVKQGAAQIGVGLVLHWFDR